MSVAKRIGGLLQLAVVCAFGYVIYEWKFAEPMAGGNSDYARSRCEEEISSRFNTSSPNVYAIEQVNNGYVVRASVRLPNGNTGKIYCLTTEHGGVKEIRIVER